METNTTRIETRGRKPKPEHKKVLGRRVSLTETEWAIVDSVCLNNDVKPSELLLFVAESVQRRQKMYENQNRKTRIFCS